MASLGRRIAMGASAITLALGGCGDAPTFSYPSPDGIVSLVVEPQREGGPKIGEQNRVYFEGQGESSSDLAGPEEVAIGAFAGPWAPASIAWVDEATVNVCPLNKSAIVIGAAPVVVSNGGAKRIYQVTTDCARAHRAASSPTAPSDAKQRPAG